MSCVRFGLFILAGLTAASISVAQESTTNIEPTSQAPRDGTASTSTTTDVPGSISYTIRDSGRSGEPRPYNFQLLSTQYAGMASANHGDKLFVGIHQLRAAYKIDSVQSVRLNQFVINNWGRDRDPSNKGNMVLDDLYVQYDNDRIARLSDDVDFRGTARIYAPTGELSQSKREVGGIRLDAEVARRFNKYFELSAHLIPYYRYQSNRSYESVSDGIGTRKANSPMNLDYYLTGTVNISKSVYFLQDAGFMRYWYKSDPTFGIASAEKEFLYLDSSINWDINDNFGLSLGLLSWQLYDIRDKSRTFAVYRDVDTEYYFSASATL